MPPKASNVHKKSKNYIIFLKFLTKWLCDKKRNIDIMNKMIKKFEIENNILKRILTYLINIPHIHWYCNIYLNDKFKYDQYETIDLLTSIVYLMDCYKFNDPKKFFYMKSNEFKDDFRYSFKKLLKEYFNLIHNIQYNDYELNFLYELYIIGEITNADLIEIDTVINNKATLKLPSSPNMNYIKSNNTTIENDNSISNDILELLCELQNKKEKQCSNCPLFNKEMVILDTNCKTKEQADIIFIGLNPNYEDHNFNKPFSSSNNNELRSIIKKLPQGTKWVITNFIMCHTSSKQELEKLGKLETIYDNCSEFIYTINSTFNPKIIVPVGSDALAKCGITEEKITIVSGKIFNIGNDIKIIPIISPSSLSKSRNQFQGIFNTSTDVIVNQLATQTKSLPIISNKLTLDNTNIIEQIDETFTFFDAKELKDNKILLIYIDPNGVKKYIIQDYNFEFYVKQEPWTQSYMVHQNMDYKVVIPGQKKYYVLKTIREFLTNMKRS